MTLTAVTIVWVVGLAGALLATVVILKLSQLVIRALLDIARLGEITEEAAQGIAANVSAIETLPDLGRVGEQLTAAAQEVRRALESLAGRLARARA